MCLRSPILNTNNQSSENEFTIVIRHYYSSLQFISVSISHICNFIYFCCCDFDRIRSIKLQWLIRFFLNRNKNKISILFMPYIPFTRIWVLIAFLFYHHRRQVFFQQGQWRCFTVNAIDDRFFMNFFDNLITHEHELLFGLLSSLDIHTSALYFRHLAAGRLTAVH